MPPQQKREHTTMPKRITHGLLDVATLDGARGYETHPGVGDVHASCENACVEPMPGSAATWAEAREAGARRAEFVAQIEHTDRMLRDESDTDSHEYMDGSDIDVALRMPRNVVNRRKARLRVVRTRSQVVSPSPDELAQVDLEDAPDTPVLD